MLRYLRYFMPDGIDEKGKFWYGVGHESYDKYYTFSEWLKDLRTPSHPRGGMIVDKPLFKLWHSWTFNISYDVCGYFRPYPEINISMFGLHFCFVLPFRNKWTDECDPPKYGIAIYSDTFWVYLGGKGNMGGGTKWWTWDIPFFTKIHVRRDVECNIDGEIKMIPYKNLESHGKDYIPLKENKLVNVRTYDYTDMCDGEIIPCKYWVEEREWRPKWLTWIRLFKYVKKYIEIEFDNEVGKKKGSWKGGCIGCSYDLKPGETAEDCIKRMEKEREF